MRKLTWKDIERMPNDVWTESPKPIETVYNGHRFRSRLEARWAVFFDALGEALGRYERICQSLADAAQRVASWYGDGD